MQSSAMQAAPQRGAGQLSLRGEKLCLDFTNTASGRGTPHFLEHLQAYDDLLDWSAHAGLVTPERAADLRAAAAARPAEAEYVLQEALGLREALHRLFSALAERDPAPERDLLVLNRWLKQSYPHLELARLVDRFSFRWTIDEADLASVLGPIVGSATEILTQAKLERVKRCPGPDCGWLFYDTTKNGTRRWCDMATCGNREKSRLHYRRQRAARISCD